jgi:hypothetical protein
MDKNYVIKNNKTGYFVAVDTSSGGYPYDVTISDAKIFTRDFAKSYRNLFPDEDWSLHALEVKTNPVSW